MHLPLIGKIPRPVRLLGMLLGMGIVLSAPAARGATLEIPALVKEYCFDCHGEGSKKGGVSLDLDSGGAGDVLSIKISPDVVDPQDVEMLEELILTGVRKAIEEGRSVAQSEMGKLTGGMGLPPGLGF